MKNYMKYITAAFLCGTMLMSSCGQTAAPAGTAASSSVNASDFAYPADYQRKAMPTSAVVTESTAQGNSGEVKLEKGDTYAVIKIKDYGDITVKLYPDEAPYAVQNFIDLALKGTYDGRNFHRIMSGFMMQGGSFDGTGMGGDSFEGGAFKNEINTSLHHFYGALCYASAMGNISDQFYIVNNKEEQPDIQMQYAYYAAAFRKKADACKQYMGEFEQGTQGYEYYKMQCDFYSDSADGASAMENTCTDAVIEKYKKGGTPSLDGGYTVFGQTVSGFDVIDKVSSVEVTASANGENSKPVNDVIIESITIHTAE